MAKRGILEHPKTIELAELLDIPECFAVGVLECLWHHVARYFPHGEVTSLKPSILARSIRYPGDGQALWDALLATGFLDEQPNGVILIHDWSEHADNSVHQLLKKREEQFADGHAPFTRARVREVNRSEEDADRSQTVHEPFTNRSRENVNDSRLPKPEPKPEPCTYPEQRAGERAGAHDEGAREDPEPSSSSSPSEMPDGTQRLTEGQFEALDGLRRDFTEALVLSSAVQAKFRRLLADGATVALIDEMVREAALIQRRKNGSKWRASRLDYFEPAVRRRLDELRHDAAATAPLAAGRPHPDPEQRSIRRAALLRAATRGQEGDFSEACEAFGAWLEGLGWEPADAGREVAVLVAEVRAEARSLRGSENGRLAEGDRRPGPADAEPAHSGG